MTFGRMQVRTGMNVVDTQGAQIGPDLTPYERRNRNRRVDKHEVAGRDTGPATTKLNFLGSCQDGLRKARTDREH